MAFIYAFRKGIENVFKIGITKGATKRSVDIRRKGLQTGSSEVLTEAACLETGLPLEGESFIHGRLAAFRLQGEFFTVTEDQLTAAFTELQVYLTVTLPQLYAQLDLVAEFDQLDNTPEMLAPSPEITEKASELREELASIGSLRDELTEREDRASVLVLEIKLAIGSARGIESIATWETIDGRRRFNSARFLLEDPELYEKYEVLKPAFDMRQFKSDHPDLHEKYSDRKRFRDFRLFDDE